ncbi:MAG TPA: hypothetical protein VGG48_13555 [Rhizomicrobium sp.]|jgi:hypothetical protein
MTAAAGFDFPADLIHILSDTVSVVYAIIASCVQHGGQFGHDLAAVDVSSG